jgi:hypothetical protein
MGIVVAFPTRRTGRARAAAEGTADGTDRLGLAGLRQAIAQLGGARAALRATERGLTTSYERLGQQRDLFQRRTEMSREIERAATRLSAAIEGGDLVALERLVPDFEALARAAADDDAGVAAETTRSSADPRMTQRR